MPDATGEFRSLADRALAEVFLHEPELATALGDHTHDDRLTDRSVEGNRATAHLYRSLLAQLSSIEVAELSGEDAADHAILANALETRVFSAETLREIEWNPLVYNPGDALYTLLARPTRPAAERLQSLASRMAQIPDRVSLARRQLHDCPRVHVETALAQNRGTLSLVRDEVPRLLAEEPSMASRVEHAMGVATTALERHAELLTELLDDATGEFRIGADRFERKLTLVLHSRIPARQVAILASAHLAETEEELMRAAVDFLGAAPPAAGDAEEGRRIVREALDRLAADAPDNDSIVADATTSLDSVRTAVRDFGLVTVPDDPIRVEVMPEHRRGVAIAYCDSPGALEEGGETFIAVAPTPSDWSDVRTASFYREYNRASLVNLMAHEAYPGHALQLAHNRGFSGSTNVRRVFRSGPFVEGWAVHGERLLAERGHGGAAVRLQQLKMQLRMTINALLDVGVHSQGMTEAEALALMRDRGHQEEGEAVGKWRRACLGSAQLSTYFVGFTELAPVIDSYRGSDYDAFLSHGSPPPSLLADLL